jgi:protein phosphatase
MDQQHGLLTTLNYSISFWARTHPGMVREVNEDSFVVLDSAAVFCVADGMGGYDAGEVASASVVQSVETFYAFRQDSEVTLPGDFSMDMFDQHPLCGSVEFAHQQLQKKMSGRTMGSTFAAVQFEEGGVAVCHVGDSRVYLLHHGTMIQLTNDHSVVSALVENGDITPEQARKHPQRNAILQAVGFSPEIKPDLQHFAVGQGDRLLICSDGVTSMLSDEQITQILVTGEGIDQQSQRVIEQANEAGGKDNITLILIEIN